MALFMEVGGGTKDLGIKGIKEILGKSWLHGCIGRNKCGIRM